MSGDTTQTGTVIKGAPTKYVKLNVGGSLHYVTLGTLTKQDNMLRAMFSGRMEVLTDTEEKNNTGRCDATNLGWILIDRSGKHFGGILNFLRDGTLPLPESQQELEELLAEAKFYLIEELLEQCEEALKKKKEETMPCCAIVRMPTTAMQEKLLVSQSDKPVIKFMYNRSNNKYSYTSHSDDNLLKNIELFDKLSLRFYQRILFIKNVIGSGEICCWTFYGNGKKVAEICCTSIVYATERKHTKVEFPEARIYEEALNIILYEKVGENQPDAELLGAIGGDVHVVEDEDEGPVRRHRSGVGE